MKGIKMGISVFLVTTLLSSLVVQVYANDNENELYNMEYIASADNVDIDTQPYESDRIIIKFKDDYKKAESRKLKSRKLNSKMAAEQEIKIENTEYSIITPKEDENVEDLIQSINREYGDDIDIIQPDYIIGTYADEKKQLIDKIEMDIAEIQTLPITNFDSSKLDLPNVDFEQVEDNNYDTGNDIVVAVIDTAIDNNHSALSGSFYENSQEVADGIDNDGNGYIDDIFGWDFDWRTFKKEGKVWQEC